ncbi:MAG: hypothetical protein ACJAWS_000677 [Oleiphilaceae bacterium]|jgi:hypothetical protein
MKKNGIIAVRHTVIGFAIALLLGKISGELPLSLLAGCSISGLESLPII